MRDFEMYNQQTSRFCVISMDAPYLICKVKSQEVTFHDS